MGRNIQRHRKRRCLHSAWVDARTSCWIVGGLPVCQRLDPDEEQLEEEELEELEERRRARRAESKWLSRVSQKLIRLDL